MTLGALGKDSLERDAKEERKKKNGFLLGLFLFFILDAVQMILVSLCSEGGEVGGPGWNGISVPPVGREE